uniref:Large ribosomal subunit protein bL33c n=1 Tax=Gloeochaete wittrockiana TaxID=38269 RepID=A0A3G1IVX8_9EUKA|nr:ribosomal protein L33 [Gloeochaete wittrockiana]ASQ40208.1 ribosomal protein L33 [Gloeochaete wittrockiana]
MVKNKGKGARILITLECTNCRTNSNPGISRYITTKNRRNTTNRIELKKFCKFCKGHSSYKETK